MLNGYFNLRPEKGVEIAKVLISNLTKSNSKADHIYKTVQSYQQICYLIAPIHFLVSNNNYGDSKSYSDIITILYYWYSTIYHNFKEQEILNIISETIQIILEMTNLTEPIIRDNALHVLEKIIREPVFEYSESTWKIIINKCIDFYPLITEQKSSKLFRLIVCSIDKANFEAKIRVETIQKLKPKLTEEDISFIHNAVEEFIHNSSEDSSFIRILWDISPPNIVINAFHEVLIESQQFSSVFIPNLSSDLILETFSNYLFINSEISKSYCLAFSQLFGIYGTKNQEWLNLFVKYIKYQISKQSFDVNASLLSLRGAITAHPDLFYEISIYLLNFFSKNESNANISSDVLEFCVIVDQLIDISDKNYKFYSLMLKNIIESYYLQLPIQSITVDIIFMFLKHHARIDYSKISKKLGKTMLPSLLLLISTHPELMEYGVVGEILKETLTKLKHFSFKIIITIFSTFVHFPLPKTVKYLISDLRTNGSVPCDDNCSEVFRILDTSSVSAPIYILDANDIQNITKDVVGERIFVSSPTSLFSFSNLNEKRLLILNYGTYGLIGFIAKGFPDDISLKKKAFNFLNRAGIDVISNSIKIVSQKQQEQMNVFEKDWYKPLVAVPILNLNPNSDDLFENEKMTENFSNFVKNIATEFGNISFKIQHIQLNSSSNVPITAYPNFKVAYISKLFFDKYDFLGTLSIAKSLIIFDDGDYDINVDKIPKEAENVLQIKPLNDKFYAFRFIRCTESFSREFSIVSRENAKYYIFSFIAPYVLNNSWSAIHEALTKRKGYIEYFSKNNNSLISELEGYQLIR
ncbi:hypothetical protein TVAG_464280 [Trichomonas vaginalis G3]|uniref:Uncharacterized protein n=1 Tax=Trichomonas vaginalis (strain ATCC PRA-98 / G3) TaxID=412133 RepID=A2E280_TRIV3|nr:armadillo (ARM) repeat-containing protein family [Trichomonas vaginalis G3]EAY13294.1 hypothetical protein TVAG_464280 [Trichomonas vaginalis G3]KAI5494052.1 armadillo (ARM) repeat-containing protein family [Trichomonas vaginalis G3]|eukprot:XP_001325517.1 hypothetical protein [Trichomonas vaginalis G3]